MSSQKPKRADLYKYIGKIIKASRRIYGDEVALGTILTRVSHELMSIEAAPTLDEFIIKVAAESGFDEEELRKRTKAYINAYLKRGE